MITSNPSLPSRGALGAVILLLALCGTGWMAACGSSSPRDVRCDRTTVNGNDYCVYSQQAITETGYNCPRELSEPVPMGGGTVCTDDGNVPDADRDELRRQYDFDDESLADAGPGVDGGEGGSCEPPSNCTPSSSPTEPTYLCHTPTSPTAGDAFTLTIYGQNLSTRSDGTVEVLTDTGYGQEIQVDDRCTVTVDFPASVWGNGRTIFTVTVKNSAGQIQFDIQGE